MSAIRSNLTGLVSRPPHVQTLGAGLDGVLAAKDVGHLPLALTRLTQIVELLLALEALRKTL
jgi:hypothetical protein